MPDKTAADGRQDAEVNWDLLNVAYIYDYLYLEQNAMRSS